MKLCDLLSMFTNSNFLLTIEGVCNEWYSGAELLQDEAEYRKHLDCRVKTMAIICTNGDPELCLEIE